MIREGRTAAKVEDQVSEVGAYVTENPAARKPAVRCGDGTYSFAETSEGVCTGRGGVAAQGPTAAVPARNVAYVVGPRGGCYYMDASGRKNYVDKKHCN